MKFDQIDINNGTSVGHVGKGVIDELRRKIILGDTLDDDLILFALQDHVPRDYPTLMQLASDRQVRNVRNGEGLMGRVLRNRLRFKEDRAVTFAETVWMAVAAAVCVRLDKQDYRFKQAKAVAPLRAKADKFYCAHVEWADGQSGEVVGARIYGMNVDSVRDATNSYLALEMGTHAYDESQRTEQLPHDYGDNQAVDSWCQWSDRADLGRGEAHVRIYAFDVPFLDMHMARNLTRDRAQRMRCSLETLSFVVKQLCEGRCSVQEVWEDEEYE